MNRFILDASVSLSWFLDNPVPDLSVRVRRSLAGGSRAVVPTLWRLEIANAFAMAERRGDLTVTFTETCLSDIEGLMASVIGSADSEVSLRQSLAAARTFRLTAYDAMYLETARRESLPLATLDKALKQAAIEAGVPLID